MPHAHKKAFYSMPLSLSNKFFFNVGNSLIIIQPESGHKLQSQLWIKNFTMSWIILKKFTTCHNLILKKHNRSDFELKKNNASDFQMKKKYNASYFEFESFRKVRFQKKLQLENHVLAHFTPSKRHKSDSVFSFKKYDSELKKYNASDFELKEIGHVAFSFENFRTSQNLKRNYFVLSDFK